MNHSKNDGTWEQMLSGKERTINVGGRDVLYYENAGKKTIVIGYKINDDYTYRGNRVVRVAPVKNGKYNGFPGNREDRARVEKALRRRGKCSFWELENQEPALSEL
ncbi:hypothetical protein COU62_02365 [Candidatus Pacearchaeota archaeon CG10_big_fil_rev_8_21_14_0_10_35_219]|nr:hypothetical protein [Candidatus Pacearchaeota archaeon]OIO41984.1 MAG: hypothetical protein AUJ63_04505 [Candidatus Pacearchaeota archaeon CG1_02_35_32]PIO07812.1 MAG: hypothetical protein COU62_02365 [Candidatus Pacearchaeota archaeon CG10_big_fil_rev_8_21_14_0_10_35_219]PIY81034.1 MAG: hypothetical protein COY79_04475 [Candidatus Pacearchaeota archaeon CG_4_10_14_0_8_um_filter_35_169]PIZ79903.1 MAG: hypothetical protein COY00_02780 [Candidatus Pacearchaeota archaeon CG_4_10_14_0_2_um_filt